MISYLLHRLFVDTYTVDMNGAAITITYYNEAPLTKVKPQNKKHANIIAERRRTFFHGHLLRLYFKVKLDIENPIIRINTAFKGCSSLEKISVLPRIYHN